MKNSLCKIISLSAVLVLCVACLVACAPAENVDAPAQNRAYMAQANTAMMKLNEDLVPFNEAAAAGDVVTMEQAAAAASRDMQAFEAITAPEDMVDIHAEYVAGCESLRAALQEYVQLYREASVLEDDVFNSRIAAVQQLYDEGIAHIQQGDKLVTELTGALPEGEDESVGASESTNESTSVSASSVESDATGEAAPADDGELADEGESSNTDEEQDGE